MGMKLRPSHWGEGRRLRLFEKRAPRRIFGPKRDEVKGDWRKLQNEELGDLYFSPSIFRVIISRRKRWARHVASLGEMIVEYRVFVGKPGGKRPLGRSRRSWKDNNNVMGLQEVGCEGMDWIDLAQDMDRWWALVNAVKNLRVPKNANHFLTSLEPVSF